MFSLSHQTKHRLNIWQDANAISYGPGYLFAFGNGCDIYLYNNCNTANNSANLGRTYEAPAGITYNTDPCRAYLGGSDDFKIREIEAFQVKFF